MKPDPQEGEAFGLLTVIEVFPRGELAESEHDFCTVWCRVRCACGLRNRVRASDLRRGRVQSCGRRDCVIALRKRGRAA